MTTQPQVPHTIEIAPDDERVSALSALGVFERCFDQSPGFPNALWKSWGYTVADHVAGLWLLLLHPEDVARVARAYSSVLSGHSHQFSEEYRLLTPSGRWRWVLGAGRVVRRDQSGRPLRYLGTETDITDRKLAESELGRAKADAELAAREAETLRRAGAIISAKLTFEDIIKVVLDQAAEVAIYDTASVQLLEDGYLKVVGGSGWANAGEVVGTRIPVPGDNPNTEVVQRAAAMCIGDVSERYPEFARSTVGTIRSWIGAPLVIRGEVVGLLTLDKRQRNFFTDAHLRLASSFADHVAVAISNAQKYEATQTQALTDSLTGLSTRYALNEQSSTLVDFACRYRHPLSVLIMDLDFFKRVNDDHGHEVGDQVLRLVAQTMKSTLRKADILCRYGGEEFVALLPETSIDSAIHLAERIRDAVRKIAVQALQGDGFHRPIRVTVSIGVSELDLENETDIGPAIRRADRALYRSKEAGRDRCTAERRDS